MRKLLPALLWIPLVSCGGGGSGGGPAPTPTVTNIVINGPEGPYLVRESYTFSATVTLSNGQTQAASGTWGGDAPTVGTMANGVFAGVGPGEVTIWIDVTQGGRATKRLRVYPSYNAAWVGSYRVTSCTDSGEIRSQARFCRDNFARGDILPLGLSMSQNGLSVTTTVYLGQLEFNPATSTMAEDGRLQVNARYDDEGLMIDAVLQLFQPQATSVGGTINHTWTVQGATGSGRLAGDLVDVVRQAGAGAAPMVAPRRSFEEMLEAIKREP